MPLSHREKQRFFDSLARLIRSGITLPAALDKLSGSADRGLRSVIKPLRKSFAAGHTATEAFARLPRELGAMEVSVLGAAERTGRMDQVLHQLADYHGALAQARDQARAKLLYPAFLFHFGVLLLSLPRLLPKSELSTEPPGLEHGLGAYLWATLGLFAAIYATGFLLLLFVRGLTRLAAENAALDRLLGWIPLVGGLRRNFALARFCLTYELHLGAGVNTPDALRTAGEASQSGTIRRAVGKAVPAVQSGAQVGEVLAEQGALPGSLIEGLLVGEESGQLDQVLSRLAATYQADAIASLHMVAEWLPRIIYLGVVAFLVVKIFQTLSQVYFGPLQKLIEGNVP